MKTVLLKQEAVYRGDLILVNQTYGYHEQLTKLSTVAKGEKSEILFDYRAGILLEQLISEIDGWEHIVPVSGWRSLEEQQGIWKDSLAENGLEFTKKYVAVPGHSEHQTGLAIDLGLNQPEIDFIRPAFPYEGICQTFREKAVEYGFIERYPANKEQITQIGHEPWHFRYVGIPHAMIMAKKGLVLEEYIAFLRGYRYRENPYVLQTDCGEIMVSYMKAEGRMMELKIDDTYPYEISGNNVDGFIITEWRQTNEGKK